MQNNNDELTFAQIIGMIKISLKRAIIYVLVALILATTTILTVNTLTSYKSSEASIYVSSSSKITQQDVTYNKSIAVQRALEKFDYDSSNEKFTDSIYESLTVNAIVPANIEKETEFNPTSYTLTLNGKKISGLTTAQQNELLDVIALELLKSFNLSELPNVEIYSTIENDLLNFEYFQIAEELYLQTEDVLKLIENQISTAPNAFKFKDIESGKTLSNLSSSLKVLLSRINNLKTNILINKIENGGTLELYLNNKIKQANAAVLSYENAVEASQQALIYFPSGVSGDSSNNTYVIDSAAYESLVKEHNKLLTLKQAADKELALYEGYRETFTTSTATPSEANKTATSDLLKALCLDLNNELNTYKALAKAYNDSYFIASEAKILNPAKSYNQSVLSTTLIILILVLVAIVAYLIAFFQENNKRKKVATVKEDGIQTDNK